VPTLLSWFENLDGASQLRAKDKRQQNALMGARPARRRNVALREFAYTTAYTAICKGKGVSTR